MKIYFDKKLNSKDIKEMLKRAFEKYKSANSSFWVTSLSFYTILALVPILAILFSLAGWFGAEDYIVHQIDKVTPLKEETLDILTSFSNNLLNNARNGVLAGVGFVFLGWTFIQMFSLIEASFNAIWHVKKSRTIIRKISDYITFFIFVPLVFIVLNGAVIFLLSKLDGINFLYYIIAKIFPLVSLTVFFMSLYLVMPNTSVKAFPAFFASLITSIAFYIFQYTFILLQSSLINYNVIYGSFSVIFIFLIWIRVSWFIIILGVHISYLIQNANFDLNIDNGAVNISFNSRLYVTLKILEELVKRYLNKDVPASLDELRKVIKSSPFLIESVLEDLIKGTYIISSEDFGEKVYCISKNIDDISLNEIYNFTSNMGEEIFVLQDSIMYDEIEKLVIEKKFEGSLRSLANLGGNSEK